ncbi:putative ATP-dependent zinc metalloprotease FTSH 6, chloroplastic [Cocos nucifera]|nr:putative ATP-dependent zinc metalloprotease FTSH 6, chloroplastic [Cocos nucifera]
MSPALSLTTAHLPICRSQEISKENNIKTPLGRRKLLKSAGLGLIGTGFAAARPTKAEPESPQDSTSSRMSYSRFLQYLNEGAVKKVDLFENGTVAIAEISNPALNRIQRVKVELPGLPKELLRKLKEKDVDFAAHPVQPNVGLAILDFLVNWGFPLLLLGSLFLRTSSVNTPGGPNLPFGLGRSKAKFQMEPNTGITFDDVAGVDEAKEDFKEIVEFLKSPEKFAAVGARIPKGVLLVGPPGTGKTLLAKAIAGEAGVPFFSLSGSEFIEMFVGVGASRVRDLFNKAKANSPCLVFIDEIDAVGRRRGTGIGGGNDEREQTLNQLLTEMDGFSGDGGVIVIAATNRPEILDSALLRPGRFDRQATVGLPDVRGREEILKVHSSNKKLDKDVSLSVIAMRTPGFSGADLANLMNEAAILAGRRGKDKITVKEIDDSIDRIVAGLEGTKMTDGKSKILVAYHEIGHAICATLTPGHDPVQKVTIIPRGQARGLTWFLPGEDPSLISKQQIFARIVGGLGGRAAEEVIFGESEVTTGAAGDLQQITQIARQMVTMFGMSEIGPWAPTDPAVQSSDVVLRMLARNSMSEKLAEDIDRSVKAIIDKAYEIAKTHIRNYRAAMDRLVEATVGLPDVRGREEILKVHSSNKKLDKDVSLSVIAMRTPGFSGADLANLMNEAAILAGRRGKDKITVKEIDDSIDRIVAGLEGTKMTDGKSKILVAYHEIGHAICATLTPGHDPVQKVTIIPRGQARGLTWFLPGEDPSLISKQQIFARIVGGLGGRAAEEVIFGESEVTTGAAGDLQQITQIARQMVTMFGMSEIGPWAPTDPAVQSSDVVLRMLARNSMSEKLAEDIDRSVKAIIDKAYEIAKTHIRNYRAAMDRTLTPGHDPVQKVTIIPRGQARGLTWFLPGEDPSLISKQQIFARIVGGLGGRAAEEVIFGESEVTTGAAGDLQQITQIARQMVTMFGMSEIGPWAPTDPAVQSSDVVLRMLARNSMSEKLAEDIDRSVKAIIDKAYEIAKTHIRNYRAAMDRLVEVLLEKETLSGDEFRAILSEFTDDEVDGSNRQTVTELVAA